MVRTGTDFVPKDPSRLKDYLPDGKLIDIVFAARWHDSLACVEQSARALDFTSSSFRLPYRMDRKMAGS